MISGAILSTGHRISIHTHNRDGAVHSSLILQVMCLCVRERDIQIYRISIHTHNRDGAVHSSLILQVKCVRERE